jgi:cytochrome c oxidase subunit 3
MSGVTATATRLEPMSPELRDQVLRLGMWMFVGTVTMLFAAFSSAYIVRGAGTDWRAVTLPSILWLNTAVILVSSGALELGRRGARGRQWTQARSWVLIALLLGVVFLIGQLAGWRALSTAGVLLPTTPYSSFFYLLTGLHGVHLAAGLVVLGVAAWQAGAVRGAGERRALRTVELGSILWHFLAGLWVYLLVLLTFFR